MFTVFHSECEGLFREVLWSRRCWIQSKVPYPGQGSQRCPGNEIYCHYCHYTDCTWLQGLESHDSELSTWMKHVHFSLHSAWWVDGDNTQGWQRSGGSLSCLKDKKALLETCSPCCVYSGGIYSGSGFFWNILMLIRVETAVLSLPWPWLRSCTIACPVCTRQS